MIASFPGNNKRKAGKIMNEYQPVIHRHDFSGACSPVNWEDCKSCAKDKGYKGPTWNTFSVGIFEWLPRVGGHGLKKGPVKVRVKGLCSAAEEVEREAKRICKQLDAGQYHGPKTITVKAGK